MLYRLLLALALFTLTPALPAAAAQDHGTDPQAVAPGTARVLRYAFPVAETGFDPPQISDLYSATMIAHIFDSPLQYDYLARPARLKPATAAAPPEVSADGMTIRVSLRPGIYFADDPAFKGQRRELVAHNMFDVAQAQGLRIDTGRLSRELGMPVVTAVSVQRDGARSLLCALDELMGAGLPAARPMTDLTDATDPERLNLRVRALLSAVLQAPERRWTADDRIDRWALHPVWGYALLAALLLLMFQAVFADVSPDRALKVMVVRQPGLGATAAPQ